MKNGETVRRFEEEFSQYVGAKYAIALCNGTATLHTALVALGVKPGDRVAVPPLTMSSTTIAVLHAGAVPVFVDVNDDDWLMTGDETSAWWGDAKACVPVSLFGLHADQMDYPAWACIDDAAQTLRKHGGAAFTSYSFQASKILALGEGGMLVTDDEELATKAREFSSLGYRMRADQPRIESHTLKSPDYDRHYSLGWNYRMSDIVAEVGVEMLRVCGDRLIGKRTTCADYYRHAFEGCKWATAQHVPEGWTHDYWTYAVALSHADFWEPFADAIVAHGGERPYAAWQLAYHEPAFAYLLVNAYSEGIYPKGLCPVSEDLQPRLVCFQTNDLHSAERNAHAVRRAIEELDGKA